MGFKKKDETFEAEFEEINNMLQSRKRRSSLVILGVEKEDINNKDLIEDDKYNLNSVNDINNKTPLKNVYSNMTSSNQSRKLSALEEKLSSINTPSNIENYYK